MSRLTAHLVAMFMATLYSQTHPAYKWVAIGICVVALPGLFRILYPKDNR